MSKTIFGCTMILIAVMTVEHFVLLHEITGPGNLRRNPSTTPDSFLSDTPAITSFSSPLLEPVAEVIPTEAPAHYILMDVSAYCICEKCCSKKWADGITASGVPAEGRICAAPPEYAFGTVFDVEGYGEWVVQDRGGAIKGDRLDLLMDSHADSILFGRQWLTVRIVE